jgi:hypothetical protein
MIRLAIYYTPAPRSPLATAAAAWLGRDVMGGAVLPRPVVAGLAETRLEEIVSDPFHYAFHGTIKPPFRLGPAVTIEDVAKRLKGFAAMQKPFTLPPLELSFMYDFFCLRPVRPCPQLQSLAAETVRHFDDFRQPPSPEELAKRRKADLTPQQENMLGTWGYPYVMDEFRFHLTLTGKVGDEGEKAILRRELQERFPQRILGDIPFDGLTLFIETDGRPMRLVDFFPFGRRERLLP